MQPRKQLSCLFTLRVQVVLINGDPVHHYHEMMQRWLPLWTLQLRSGAQLYPHNDVRDRPCAGCRS